MTIKKEPSRSTSPSSSLSLITATQQSLPSTNQSQSQDKDKEKATDFDSISTLTVGVYSNLTGDISRIRRYAGKILYDHKSTLELRSDGSLTITPPSHHHLPTELISLIIHQVLESHPDHWKLLPQKMLYQCSLVSKSFHAIANPLLWRAPFLRDCISSKHLLDCISSTTAPITSKQRQHILGRYIHQMDLDNYFWTSTRLKRLLSRAPLLNHLSISAPTRITDTGFQHLSHYGQHLTSLKLEGIHLSRLYFDVIGQHLLSGRLRRLELISCNKLLPIYVSPLLLSAPPSSSATTTTTTTTTITTTVSSPSSQLDHLVIDDMSVADETARLLVPVIQQFQHLTYLNMINLVSPSVTQTLLKSTHCWPYLKTLHIGNCDLIDDTLWLLFMIQHPDLCDIQLNGTMMTDASLDAIPVYLPSLTRLALSFATSITADGIRRLIRRRHELQQQQQQQQQQQHTSFPQWTAIRLFACRLIKPSDFPESLDYSYSLIHLDPLAINKIIKETPSE